MKTSNYLKLPFYRRLVIILILIVFTCCKQETIAINNSDVESAGKVKNVNITNSNTVYTNRTINWDGWAHGATYTLAMANSDFGNISDYTTAEEGRTSISTGFLKVNLAKDVHGTAGGVNARIDITDRDSYELKYKVKFHSAFDWAPQQGGVLGFGILFGDGITGSGDPTLGNGGSFRISWKSESNGNAYFRPYVYHVDQPNSSAQDFGKKYPASGSLQCGVWYNVRMVAKSNSHSNNNGQIKLYINDVLVHENNSFRWTTNNSKRYLKNLIWSCYRGTSGQSTTSGQIYFDDFELKDLANNYYYNGEYEYTKYYDTQSSTYYFLTKFNNLDQNSNQINLQLGKTILSDGETTSQFASRIGSTLAFNASTERGGAPVMSPIGIQIIDGVKHQDLTTGNLYTLGIKPDNELVAYPPTMTADDLLADGVKHALTAFIPLIENSVPVASNILQLRSHFSEANPRQIIAQYANKNFVVLSCGGRGYDGLGMTAQDVIRILTAQGVKFAYMLDGGGSTSTVVKETLITKKIDDNGTTERKRPSFLYIKK